MKKTTVILQGSASLACLVLTAYAANPAYAACTIPNTLANGQVADATKVMGNFSAVAACADAAATAAAATAAAAGQTAGGRVTATEATSSTSYTDLATFGPSVTLTTGTEAYITISAVSAKTTPNNAYTASISIEVSGATTIVPVDANGTQVASPGSGFATPMSTRYKLTGLNPGTNTFTMKYKVDGQAFSFRNRSIIVETRN